MVATIQFIEQVIATFEAAAQANFETPAREGNTIVLTPELASDVMVTADLHGHRKNFNSIKKIADLANHPRRHLILQEVCHGGPTYSSGGGCMSHAMLEDVARLKVTYPERVHFLLSNHELAELTDYPILKNRKMLNLMFRLGLQEMYGAATDRIRKAYCKFLETCPLAVRLSTGVFICHSLPERVDKTGFRKEVFDRPLEPLDYREQGDVFRIVWGRDYREENARAFANLVGARVLINGHEPCDEGFCVPNPWQVVLDCSDDPATYLILPLSEQLTHDEIVERIQKLP